MTPFFVHPLRGVIKSLATTYSPVCSTIGAEELNDCVRKGNRCGLLAMITKRRFKIYRTNYERGTLSRKLHHEVDGGQKIIVAKSMG